MAVLLSSRSDLVCYFAVLLVGVSFLDVPSACKPELRASPQRMQTLLSRSSMIPRLVLVVAPTRT